MGERTPRPLWASLIAAGALALLATLGGGWGIALGQTAGPPPTRPPAGSPPIAPVVTPPPGTEYRPATLAPAPGPQLQPSAIPTSPRPAPSLTPLPSPLATSSPAASPDPTTARTGGGLAAPVAPSPEARATPGSSEDDRSREVLWVALGGVAAAGAAGFWFWWRARPGP